MIIRRAALIATLCFAASVWAADDEGSEPATKDADTQQTQTTQQPTAETTGKKGSKPGVLDFEAELIEGERKSPDMFLQLQSGTPNLDAILFQRTNFNDFHNLEKHRRPLYRRYVK